MAQVTGCDEARVTPVTSGVHVIGWADKDNTEFHGRWLAANGDRIGECQPCHGDDYAGGAVGLACASAGCHTGSPEQCDTCHGVDQSGRPKSGAHAKHAGFCAECHRVPAMLDAPGHRDGVVGVAFSGIAIASGATPRWDSGSRKCSNSYCHGTTSPAWNDATALGCDGCHDAPPASHQRFTRVIQPGACFDCHEGSATSSTHVNGSVDVSSLSCNTCHGGANAAPPQALDGATSTSDPGVGAHQRHIASAIDERMGRTVPCASCHTLPQRVTAEGHIDGQAPADVVLPRRGQFDPAEQTCTVWCHWDAEPGPRWTDDSGDARACDSCHGFPPVRTRRGTAHPAVVEAPSLDLCLQCHSFSVQTHVDGEVNFAF